MAQLRLISNNAYLLPEFIINIAVLIQGDRFPSKSCKKQRERAANLGKLCSNADIVQLQEIWGGASDVLINALKNSHQIIERYNSSWEGIFGPGHLSDFWNALKLSVVNQNGGLFSAFKKENAKLVFHHHHQFLNKEEHKGVSLSIFDLSTLWGDQHYLLVLNTHLYSMDSRGNSEVRQRQKLEIANLLVWLQGEIQKRSDWKWAQDFTWKRCGVILMGDLNMVYQQWDGTASVEYLETVNQLFGVQLRDLILETDPGNVQHTYDGNNPFVNFKDESARLDYVFLFDSIPAQPVEIKPADQVNNSNTGAETKPIKTIPVMRLKGEAKIVISISIEDAISDHYPISITLQPDTLHA